MPAQAGIHENRASELRASFSYISALCSLPLERMKPQRSRYYQSKDLTPNSRLVLLR